MSGEGQIDDRPVRLSDIGKMWEFLRQLSSDHASLRTSLQEHMQNEERGMSDIKTALGKTSEGINELSGQVRNLIASMPEDEHGRLDTFGHKVDHVVLRTDRKERAEDKKTIRATAVEILTKLSIGLAVMVVLGEHAQSAIKHMMG